MSDQQQSPFPLELFKEIHSQTRVIKFAEPTELAALLSRLVQNISDTLTRNSTRGNKVSVPDDCILLCGLAIKLYESASKHSQHESRPDRQQSR